MLRRRNLIPFFAGCDLSGLQKSFDEFAFAANGQAGKFLDHWPAGTSGSVRRQSARSPSWSAEDCDGEFAAWLFAVKPAVDFIPQFFDFRRVSGFNHALRESG